MRVILSFTTPSYISLSSALLTMSVVSGEKDGMSKSSKSSREYTEASSRFSGLWPCVIRSCLATGWPARAKMRLDIASLRSTFDSLVSLSHT